MRKSVSKRLRFTRTGKVVRRPMGVDHFRTRKTTKNIKSKGKTLGLNHPIKDIINNSYAKS